MLVQEEEQARQDAIMRRRAEQSARDKARHQRQREERAKARVGILHTTVRATSDWSLYTLLGIGSQCFAEHYDSRKKYRLGLTKGHLPPQSPVTRNVQFFCLISEFKSLTFNSSGALSDRYFASASATTHTSKDSPTTEFLHVSGFPTDDS